MALLKNMRALPRLLPAVAAMLLTAAVPARAQSGDSQREYAVKAVFLYNFSQFVDWPDNAFPTRKTPLTIGVIGDDPFGPLLDEAVAGETARNRPIRVLRLRRLEEIKQCHILFVARSEMDRMDAIVEAARAGSVLTVGETEDFLAGGGMIALTTERGKVRLRINAPTIQMASLSVSSKLLRIASQR